MNMDQSFVRGCVTSDDDILVDAIIGIGKGLRHYVIAEGIETAKQLAFFRENHCPAVQGFYLNEPMIAEDFAGVLKRGIPAHILG